MNICDYLARSAALVPERTALVDLDAPVRVELSYQQLWEHVRRTARGLVAHGLQPGDRVALLTSNSWEYVEAFLALACAGMVAVPLNTRLLVDELKHMVTDSGARLLIAEENLLAEKPVLATIPELGVALIRPDAGNATVYSKAGQRAFTDLRARDTLPPVDVRGTTLMSLMYTSGTTGLPKGVMLSHDSWSVVAEQTLRLLSYTGPERTVHAAPMTHGSGFLMLPTFACGGTNYLYARFDPERVLDSFHTEGITNGFFVPSMIRMLLDAPQPAGRSGIGALKTIYYAGSPIDPLTLREALRRFPDCLVQSFGQMESPMFFSILDRLDHRAIAADEESGIERSAGRPVTGVRLRIVDDDGNEVPTGEVGEIVAVAPQTMLGYWNRPEATAESLRNGWLHTGDLGRMDAHGYLHIVDRKKDMIISGGSNVYAREVEQVLLQRPDLADCAVIGLPHPKWGEMVVAVLVGQDGKRVPDAELEGYAREHLPDYRRPKRYLWTDVLPRNAYGKILKRELRIRFAKEGVSA